MTWILSYPHSFGRYRPDATFVDEEDKLRAEFERAGTIAEGEHPDHAYLMFRRASRLQPSRPTQPAQEFQMATKWVLDRPAKDYADILSGDNRQLIVSAPVMETIQRLEPDVHQFWPIEFLRKDGTPASDTRYFAMLVLQSRDAFRPEHSNEGSIRTMQSYAMQWHLQDQKKALLKGVAIEEAAVNGAHIWWEERLISACYVLSDALSDALRDQGLTLWPKFQKCRSV